jgi:nitroreductase
MEFNELASLIKGRHSIRTWQKKEVPEELLLKAVELATWAPNGGNFQNWHFYIIKNQKTINAIADAVQSSANMIASWKEAAQFPETVKGLLGRSDFFKNAPAAIVISAAQYHSPIDQILTLKDEKDPQAKKIKKYRQIADTRIQSVASAIGYLLLILHQMGLGTVWMTGPMQAKGEIEKILNVPKEMDVIAYIPVGYPAETPQPKGRKPVTEVSEVLR